MEGILAYIGIGSNMGDALLNCRQAVEKLSYVSGITVERGSSFYKTEPMIDVAQFRKHGEELKHQDWFINAACEVKTILAPRALLQKLQEIEKEMGRVRTFAGAPRLIDLDLLLYGQDIIREVDLIVPHPVMHKRRFVLEPLCEIASYVVHPVFGVSIRGLKDRFDDNKIVEICR